MKKYFILIYIIVFNFLSAKNISIGDVYNLFPRGSAYKGILNGNLGGDLKEKKKDVFVKILPFKDIEILSINGMKDNNGIYNIKKEKFKIEFLYKGKNFQNEDIIDIANLVEIDSNNEVVLQGKIQKEFRKKGELKLDIKNGMDFGTIDVKQLKKGIQSKNNAKIDIRLNLDEKDVKNTKLYFEYPKKIEFGEGTLSVELEDRNSKSSKNTIKNIGQEKNVLSFIPTSKNYKETIEIAGNLKSNIEKIPPGRYIGLVKVKAYYEYSNFSLDEPEENKKLVVRR